MQNSSIAICGLLQPQCLISRMSKENDPYEIFKHMMVSTQRVQFTEHSKKMNIEKENKFVQSRTQSSLVND